MKKRLPLILLVIILLVAAFLRLYRISDYMTFLGDEGRDVLVAKDILSGDFTLLGPRSSAGDFFMGPAYYYMITPFLFLFRFDPVGPAVMVALFSVATAWLIYLVAKRFFTTAAGLFASALYAVSPLVINYSHSSWNPNVLPFFSLLSLAVLYDAVKHSRSWKYFLFVGVLLGIAIQLHYLTLFLIIIVALFVFLAPWFVQKKKLSTKFFVLTGKRYLQLFLGFVIGWSPFLLFEVRHGFPNLRSITAFILGVDNQELSSDNNPFFSTVSDVYFRIFARLIFDYPTPARYDFYNSSVLSLWSFLILFVAIMSFVFIFQQKNKIAAILLFLWFFVGGLLFGFYKKEVYDYLFTFLFPLPFLLIGNFFSQIYYTGKTKARRILWHGISVLLFLGLFIFLVYRSPLLYEPNRQKNQVKTIAEFVIEKSEDKPFNFALISGGNSDHAYRYYFDVLGKQPVGLQNPIEDPERKTVTDQLLVVCEDPACEPLGHSLFEVAGFGRAEIEDSWNVLVVKVYKLVPYKEGKEERSIGE